MPLSNLIRGFVGLVFVCLVSGPLTAQTEVHLDPETRVRLSITPDDELDRGKPLEIRARVVRHTPDTLIVRIHSEMNQLVIPTAWIEELEVSRGSASALRGAWRGGRAAFLLGAAIGGIVGGEIASMGHESFLEAIPKRIALYGLASGLSGAILGAMNPGEKWVHISIHQLAGRQRAHRILLALSFPSR